MKTFLQFNIVIQVMWLVAIIGLLFEPVYLLYLAFFMGINHLLISIILLIIQGTKSKLLPHLIGSSIYLLLLVLSTTIGETLGFGSMIGRDFGMLLMAVPPIVLACNFWYTSFIHLNPFKKVEHNVLDL